MKRSFILLFLVGLLIIPSTAFASAVAKSMGNLRWGMSDTEVTSVVKKALKKEYSQKVKKGMSKSSAKSEYKRRLKAFERSYTEFDGRSRWDSTSVAEEYTHGNHEAMMVLEGKGGDNYYFFIEGRLWKWVRTMPGHAFSNHKQFAKTVKKRFGRGYAKKGEINKGSGAKYKYIEFLDRNNRLRAVDKTGNYGEYALIFEEMETVRSLAGLRSGGKRNKARSNSVDDDDSSSRQVASTSKRKGKKRRSLFADERDGESDAEYQARKRKVLEERKRKQRAMFERKQEAKKGKVLDGLEGIEDDDPLAGF
jgi:hypothetical protein